MIFNVKNYGAVANGKDFDTVAIQAAVDECFNAGGGKVVMDGGTFLSKPFRLKSNVELVIKEDAVLLASPNCDDYFEWNPVTSNGEMPRSYSASFIFADGEENVTISGEGKIDCNGSAFVCENNEEYGWKFKRISTKTPPRVVFITDCNKVTVKNITLTNAPSGWAYWINGCKNVKFSNCKILTDVDYPNNDGIHLNCVNGAIVENCDLRCGDDCIAVRANNSVYKDETKNLACENIVVRNCKMVSYSSAIRLGWINDGVIRNCRFENIVMDDSTVGIGISLPDKLCAERSFDEGREYSLVQNIVFKNITMNKIFARPVIIRVGLPDATLCKGIENILFENITANAMEFPYIAGKECAKIGPVTMKNCKFVKLPITQFDGYKKHGAYIWSIFSEHNGLYSEYATCKFLNTEFIE